MRFWRVTRPGVPNLRVSMTASHRVEERAEVERDREAHVTMPGTTAGIVAMIRFSGRFR